MFTQLALAGALRGLAGIAFGSFTEVSSDSSDHVEGQSLEAVLQEVAERVGVPCISGIPMGHVREQWTLPLGLVAELDADACTLVVPEASFAHA